MLVRMGRWAGGREAADEGKHFDDDVAVVVGEAREGTDDEDVAAEFFAEFADERVIGRLAGLDFAAGEFPFQREVLVRGALGDEHATSGVLEDGADDGDGGGRRHG